MFRKFKLVILAALLSFACAKSVDTTHQMEFSSTLKDLGTISVKLVMEFENVAGLEEIKAKEDRIKRAFSLILREYTVEKLGGRGKRTATKVMRKILDSEVRSKVVKLEILQCDVHPRNGKKS